MPRVHAEASDTYCLFAGVQGATLHNKVGYSIQQITRPTGSAWTTRGRATIRQENTDVNKNMAVATAILRPKSALDSRFHYIYSQGPKESGHDRR